MNERQLAVWLERAEDLFSPSHPLSQHMYNEPLDEAYLMIVNRGMNG